MYNVYKIDAKACYDGFALVAAESVEDANEIISDFKAEDPHTRDDYGCDVIRELEKAWKAFNGA